MRLNYSNYSTEDHYIVKGLAMPLNTDVHKIFLSFFFLLPIHTLTVNPISTGFLQNVFQVINKNPTSRTQLYFTLHGINTANLQCIKLHSILQKREE